MTQLFNFIFFPLKKSAEIISDSTTIIWFNDDFYMLLLRFAINLFFLTIKNLILLINFNKIIHFFQIIYIYYHFALNWKFYFQYSKIFSIHQLSYAKYFYFLLHLFCFISTFILEILLLFLLFNFLFKAILKKYFINNFLLLLFAFIQLF